MIRSFSCKRNVKDKKKRGSKINKYHSLQRGYGILKKKGGKGSALYFFFRLSKRLGQNMIFIQKRKTHREIKKCLLTRKEKHFNLMKYWFAQNKREAFWWRKNDWGKNRNRRRISLSHQSWGITVEKIFFAHVIFDITPS